MFHKSNPKKKLVQKHVDSLTQAITSAKACNREKPPTLWEAPVHSPASTFFIVIDMSSSFPESAPAISLKSPYGLSHSHMDDNGVFHFPSLEDWNAHCDLGRIIKEIISELTDSPPFIAVSRQVTPVKSESRVSHSPNIVEDTKEDDIASMMVAPVPSRFKELENKTETQLTELLSSEVAFEAFIETLEWHQNTSELRGSLRMDCVRLAKANLEYKAELERVRCLVEVASVDYSVVRERYTELDKRRCKVLERYSVRRLLDMLDAEIEERDCEARDVRDKLVDGDMGLPGAIKEYTKAKKEMYWNEMLRERLVDSTK